MGPSWGSLGAAIWCFSLLLLPRAASWCGGLQDWFEIGVSWSAQEGLHCPSETVLLLEAQAMCLDVFVLPAPIRNNLGSLQQIHRNTCVATHLLQHICCANVLRKQMCCVKCVATENTENVMIFKRVVCNRNFCCNRHECVAP